MAEPLSDRELFGAQERINANIRRAFDMVLSSRGMQRPRLTEESRFVGLEFTLQFYETVRVRTLANPTGQRARTESSLLSHHVFLRFWCVRPFAMPGR
jgi:hypothetical protein